MPDLLLDRSRRAGKSFEEIRFLQNYTDAPERTFTAWLR